MRLDDPRATLLAQPGDQTEHPPGTVAILAGDVARFTRFWVCAMSLVHQLPARSSVKVYVGSDISESRNQACEEMEGEWVWFIDDDHAFKPDVVTRLLDRNVDIVQPVCLRRSQPFLPVATDLDGNFLDVRRYGPDDVVEVLQAGSSGMLIRKAVLDAVEAPWFELGHDERGFRVSEDVSFCQRAKAAGFGVHVDMGTRIGHMTASIVWPVWSEDHDRWLTGVTVADGAQLAIDPAEIPEAAAP